MSADRFAADFAQHGLDAHLRDADYPVVVACSGGSDSIALLHLTVRAIGAARVRVVTVNHNLRDVAAEIALVARHCEKLGVLQGVADWHWDGKGNLQSAARKGRRAALIAEAEAFGAGAILVGHTRDDQAETVLMRLARGSGVDGLSGMDGQNGLIRRPLLNLTRSALRDWLRVQGLDWAEDPSNDDIRFDRVRARHMAGQLAELGLTHDRLLQTADLMRQERQALHWVVRQWAETHVRDKGALLEIPAPAFGSLPASLKTRLLAQVIRWFNGGGYPPRRDALAAWEARVCVAGERATLGGVIGDTDRDSRLVFTREPAAAGGAVPVATPWDHRWIVTGPDLPGSSVSALGEAVSQCPGWRETGLPRGSLLATPAVWNGVDLVAAPVAGLANGWTATLRPTFAEFLDTH